MKLRQPVALFLSTDLAGVQAPGHSVCPPNKPGKLGRLGDSFRTSGRQGIPRTMQRRHCALRSFD
jgi:hypothetical protein